MMKMLKKKLAVSVALLCIAVIALIITSYTWFLAITSNKVEVVDLYVDTVDFIMFSALSDPDIADDSNWKASITNNDIELNQPDAFPENMLNVSSVFNITNNNFYIANFTSNGDIAGYTVVSQQNNYAKFSIWVKSSRDGFIYLDADSIVTSTEGMPKAGIAYTIRIGFVPVDYDSVSGENWNKAIIWEPNSKEHLDIIYGGSGGTDKGITVAATGVLASDTSETTTYDFEENDTNISGDDTKIGLFNLSMNTKQKFNVYIWIEGADIDTFGVVANSSFRTYMKFGQAYDSFLE